MIQHPIQPGDAVRLNAGGPLMTVRAISQNLAYCVWEDGAGQQAGTFETRLLQRFEDGPDPREAPSP